MATTVNFTSPGEYTWDVPSGVSRITLECWGGEGGDGGGDVGGLGGYATGEYDVSSGQTLTLHVAGKGTDAVDSTDPPGGFGGGGGGGRDLGGVDEGGAGGGGSHVYPPGSTADADRIIVAGGGGGAGGDDGNTSYGGYGGGSQGGDGVGWSGGGGGGTQTSGGSATGSAGDGSFYNGGTGEDNDYSGGGGGGGGWYGGGGGGGSNASGGGGGSGYIGGVSNASMQDEVRSGDGQITITYVTSPNAPENVSATVDADDQITLSWDAPSSGDDPTDYDIEILRDNGSWVSPSGGPSTVSHDGSVSYSATYGPNSDNSYGSQVGIDSSFQFRVKARNSAGSSGWTSSGTVYTTPIPPHDLTVSRPDAGTVRFAYTVQSDIAEHFRLEYREDTGSGYGSWTWFDTATGSESHIISGSTDTKGSDVTIEYSVGTSYQAGLALQQDARYQFRAQTGVSGAPSSASVYADYGNEGNVYFEDDFETGDFSNWDTTSGATVESGSGNVDLGIGGADQGTYWAYLQNDIDTDGEVIQKNLGDLSSESDVIVKCAMAAGSMDNSTEWTVIDWYDGSTWQELVAHGHEYNKQGWVEVTALVPNSYLSTDNRVRFGGRGGLGGGDYHAFDRVVVADILHEYTTPAGPSALSLSTPVEGEITGSWTLNASHSDKPAHFQEWRQRRSGSGATLSKTNVQEATSYTAAGLLDGEQYDVRIDSLYKQVRRGSNDSWWRGTSTLEAAVTVLPAPTTLTVDAITATSADISWTDNHDYGDTRIQFKQSDAASWSTFSTLSRNTEAETLTELLHGEQYDVRVLAATEHTTTEDI